MRLKNKIILFSTLTFGFLFFYKAYPVLGGSYKYIKLLINVIKIVQESYVEEIPEQKLVYGAARGVVSELDGFSVFMEPKIHKRISGDIEGEFGGVGIIIAPGVLYDHKYIEIITPVPGSPAYKAGILPQDKIIKIEQKSTADITVIDATDMLRGKKGTKVSFTVLRKIKDKAGKPATEVKEFTVKRAKISTQIMQAKMLDKNIGYIHLDDFSGHTTEKVKKQLNKFKKEGMNGLILDLRYNPGGLLFAAIDLAKFFVGENKMIVYTKGRKPENYQEFKADSNAPFGDLPLVVLVNGVSASGSEIVAGALQDHKRAVIVGSRTFGKGNVQSVIPLSDGSGLSLTIAIHRNSAEETGGIEPDIAVKVDSEIAFQIFRQYTTIYQPGKEPKSAVDGKIEDEALNRAVEILKARKIFTAQKKSKSSS
jgi:carboxyl-terminal processing protease